MEEFFKSVDKKSKEMRTKMEVIKKFIPKGAISCATCLCREENGYCKYSQHIMKDGDYCFIDLTNHRITYVR